MKAQQQVKSDTPVPNKNNLMVRPDRLYDNPHADLSAWPPDFHENYNIKILWYDTSYELQGSCLTCFLSSIYRIM